jgi:Skp family chaperone for outer membrane proteins
METAKAGGAAHDATVETGPPDPDHAVRERRQAYVAQLEAEVAAIEEKLAGWRDALAAKKAELKQARRGEE